MPDIDAAFENECSSPYVYRSTPPVTGITSARTSVASRVRFNAESPCKRPRRQAIQKRVTNRKADVEDEPQLPPLPKLSFPSYVATDKLVIHKRVSSREGDLERKRRKSRDRLFHKKSQLRNRWPSSTRSSRRSTHRKSIRDRLRNHQPNSQHQNQRLTSPTKSRFCHRTRPTT